MSLYLDRKYLLLTSARLQQFKEKSADLFNFRCPFCGDSRKNKLKARGYVFKAQEYNGYGYKCWNCNVSTNFNGFLKFLDPLMHKDYIMEKFEAEGGSYSFQKIETTPITAVFEDGGLELDENDPVGIHHITLPNMNQLADDHYAKAYIMARKIPVEQYDQLFFADDFKKFLDEQFPWHGKDKLKENDPRIVMFYTDRAGYITTVNGRSFSADPKQRYMKVKIVEARKIFAINKLILDRKTYLVEGEFDSMFLENAIASGDSNLNGTADWMYDTFGVDPVCVFDKEPRNKQLVEIINDTIKEGWDVCMLPESFPGKDINEAVLAGLTPKEIQDIIDTNTFNGLGAMLMLASWKRC